MLYDGTARLIKFLYKLESLIGIQDVVIAQLLAAQHLCIRDTGLFQLFTLVEPAFLMRVFAIPHLLSVHKKRPDHFFACKPFAQVIVNCRIIGCGCPKRLDSQFLEGFFGNPAFFHFIKETGIVLWVNNHGDILEILACCPDKRNSADVYVLKRIFHAWILGYCGFKWIKVHDNHVNFLQFVLRKLLSMLLLAADCKDSAKDARMQCLDPAIQNFRAASVGFDFSNLYPILFKKRGCSACCENFYAVPGQPFSEISNPCLVKYAD